MPPPTQQLTVAEQKEEISKLNLKTIRRLNPHLANDPEFQAEIKPQEFKCPGCGGPMYISPGQIVYAHKKCKKRLKAMWRRMNKGKYNI